MNFKMTQSGSREFIPTTISVLTISDTRTDKDDKSGDAIVNRLQDAGHKLYEKLIVPDDIYQIRAAVSVWMANPEVQVVITTGGTGVSGRDGSPEAIAPLLDKTLDGLPIALQPSKAAGR